MPYNMPYSYLHTFILIPSYPYFPATAYLTPPGVTLAARQKAFRNRHMKEAKQWTVHTRRLSPLVVGHHVHIQSQTGSYPNKWDKTGIIIEVCQFDQYVVCVDGPGRISLRTRKFLRRYVPVQAPQPGCTIHDDFRQLTKLPAKPAASPTLQPTTCTSTTPASKQPTPDPLAKAHQAQFPLLLPQDTPAPATQNQQSALHSVLSQSHHRQRLFWSPTRPAKITTHPCEPIGLDSSHTQMPTPHKTALALRILTDNK